MPPGAVVDRFAAEDAMIAELLKARGQDIARDAEIALKGVETARPEKGLQNDQHRPPLTDQMQRVGDRAVQRLQLIAGHDREFIPKYLI